MEANRVWEFKRVQVTLQQTHPSWKYQ